MSWGHNIMSNVRMHKLSDCLFQTPGRALNQHFSKQPSSVNILQSTQPTKQNFKENINCLK